MNIFDPLFSLLGLVTDRTRVRQAAVPHLVGYLRELLKERDFPYMDKITDAVGNALIQEALRRAAEREKDGMPRSGPSMRETERIADETIEIYHSYPDVDSRLKNILHFHKVL